MFNFKKNVLKNLINFEPDLNKIVNGRFCLRGIIAPRSPPWFTTRTEAQQRARANRTDNGGRARRRDDGG